MLPIVVAADRRAPPISRLAFVEGKGAASTVVAMSKRKTDNKARTKEGEEEKNFILDGWKEVLYLLPALLCTIRECQKIKNFS